MVLHFVSPHHSQFEVIQAAAQLQLAQGEDGSSIFGTKTVVLETPTEAEL